MKSTDTQPKHLVKCPCCGTEITWSSDNPNRPFCSETCKNKDFVGWANEEHIIEGNTMYDDLLSDDLNAPKE